MKPLNETAQEFANNSLREARTDWLASRDRNLEQAIFDEARSKEARSQAERNVWQKQVAFWWGLAVQDEANAGKLASYA